MKIRYFVSIFISIVFLLSCNEVCLNGNGEMTTTNFVLNSFSGVKNEVAGTMKLHRGEPKVTLTSDKNIIDLFDVGLGEGNLLVIRKKDNTCFTPSDVNIDVYNDNFYKIIIGGDVNCYSDPLNLSPNVILNGIGTVLLTGLSQKQILTNNANGLIDMTKMPTENAEVFLNGSGDIKAVVHNEAIVESRASGDVYVYDINGVLDVKIQGSGNVYYSGKPSKIISVIQSSGKIIKLN